MRAPLTVIAALFCRLCRLPLHGLLLAVVALSSVSQAHMAGLMVAAAPAATMQHEADAAPAMAAHGACHTQAEPTSLPVAPASTDHPCDDGCRCCPGSCSALFLPPQLRLTQVLRQTSLPRYASHPSVSVVLPRPERPPMLPVA